MRTAQQAIFGKCARSAQPHSGRFVRSRRAAALRAVTAAAITAWAACGADPVGQTVVVVTVDRSKRFQVIRGWSCNPYYMGASAWQMKQVLDDAVFELGLTRIRRQQPNGNRAVMRRWEWENDDESPYHIDWKRFNTTPADRFVQKWIPPFKKRVESRGEPFDLWLSPSFFDRGSTGSVPVWMLRSPAEYAENAVSFMVYLRRKFGLETTHYAICNEAGNNNAFTPEVVINMTKVLGLRMREMGLQTRGQFPDSINARTAWRYIPAPPATKRSGRISTFSVTTGTAATTAGGCLGFGISPVRAVSTPRRPNTCISPSTICMRTSRKAAFRLGGYRVWVGRDHGGRTTTSDWMGCHFGGGGSSGIFAR